MRLPRSSADAAILSSVLFPFLSTAAGNIECNDIRVDHALFDLSKLGGPRSVMHSFDQGVSLQNTTYTIDICKPLGKVKDIPADQQCPDGTRVCGIQRLISKDGVSDTLEKFIPIAGELKGKGGGELNALYERLKTSKLETDSGKEGLRVVLNGGYLLKETTTRSQKAIVEFICDKERTGLEHLYEPEDKYPEVQKREDVNAREDSGPNSASLEFIKYDTDSGDTDVLQLKWRTQYACEHSKRDQEAGKVQHWGFFTWFIIIFFLSTATYLIFGSWLNYNRYGARGWDLLPHGDTIRDVPYLFKDWMRRVLNTVQGGGSRGGYAAV